MLLHERDSGIRLNWEEVETYLLSRIDIKEDHEPTITYELPLTDAIKFEISRNKDLIKKPVRAITKAAKVADKKEQLHTAASAPVTREELMNKDLHEGAEPLVTEAAVNEEAQAHIVPEAPMDLCTLADRLLGKDLILDDAEKKTVRIMYRKMTETNSKDESDDFKTVIEVIKDDPEELDKHPAFKELVEKIKETI